MKGLVKKQLLLVITAVVIVLFMPVMAYAGDGIDIDDIVQGVNPDGTVDPGATLSVSLADLENRKSGIKEHYEKGEISIEWCKGDFGAQEALETTYSGGVFSAKVTLKDAGKKFWLSIGCNYETGFDDTGYNLTGTQFKVYGGEISINQGPSFGNAYTTKVSPIVKHFTFEINDPYLNYTCKDSGKTYTSYDDMYIKLTRNGEENIIQDMKLPGPTVTFKNVSLPIGKKDKFKTTLYFYYGTQEIAIHFSFEQGADKLTKNYTYATKIDKNRAYVRWTGTPGASGYYIYQGKKKIKTVKASKRKVLIKRKKAGKSKFKVIPFVKSGAKKIKGKSTVMKAKTNSFKTGASANYKNYSYGRGQLVLSKVSAAGTKYTITCYAINNRIFDLKKYSKISIRIYADNKCVASTSVKNKTVNVKANSAKKLTFTVKKGKLGDIRHGTVSYQVSYTPYWGPGIKSW